MTTWVHVKPCSSKYAASTENITSCATACTGPEAAGLQHADEFICQAVVSVLRKTFAQLRLIVGSMARGRLVPGLLVGAG